MGIRSGSTMKFKYIKSSLIAKLKIPKIFFDALRIFIIYNYFIFSILYEARANIIVKYFETCTQAQ
jgi:hypothetical protein